MLGTRLHNLRRNCAALVAVTAFEVDVQLVHGGWESDIVALNEIAEAEFAAKISAVRPWLLVHLVFAITTPVLWVATIVLALKRFWKEPSAGASQSNSRSSWLGVDDRYHSTSLTGLLFYYMAFVR
ncbi:MAG: hypothetical protein U0936_08060 [Planctomycetaceae bacterium]